MVEGVIGKEQPFQLRFVPKDHKLFVWDYAGVIALACPQCGAVELRIEPATLEATRKATE